ncbi:MAG TPA: alpha/beta hydrolase [Polyangiaceae bacterium]
MASAAVEAWRRRGRTVRVGDGDVWALDVPGQDPRATPVLVLHGFPASSFDFAAVIDRIAPRRRVVALDFPGFGLSCKPPDLGYSLFEHADVVLEVARAFELSRAHVWAHDMGTSVATELLARRERGLCPLAFESLTLMNGSVHVELAHLTLGQKLLRSPLGSVFARLNTRATFVRQLRRTFGRQPDGAVLDAMWELLARDGGAERMRAAIGYVGERRRFRRRWIGALERCDVPLLVAWGRRDPVAVMAIAERIARGTPGARLQTWDDLGHWPQIEAPERVAGTVTAFWDAVG